MTFDGYHWSVVDVSPNKMRERVNTAVTLACATRNTDLGEYIIHFFEVCMSTNAHIARELESRGVLFAMLTKLAPMAQHTNTCAQAFVQCMANVLRLAGGVHAPGYDYRMTRCVNYISLAGRVTLGRTLYCEPTQSSAYTLHALLQSMAAIRAMADLIMIRVDPSNADRVRRRVTEHNTSFARASVELCDLFEGVRVASVQSARGMLIQNLQSPPKRMIGDVKLRMPSEIMKARAIAAYEDEESTFDVVQSCVDALDI